VAERQPKATKEEKISIFGSVYTVHRAVRDDPIHSISTDYGDDDA
jgi:hypothetical protein